MNSCTLMAEVVQEPELRYTSDTQAPISQMLVEFPALRDEDPPAQIKVVAWGKLAEQMQSEYVKGDNVIIEGRIGISSLERPEGFKEKRAELTASRLHKL